MQLKSIRLTDHQWSAIQKLARTETKKTNPLIRELIDIGLHSMGISDGDIARVPAVPRYEMIGTHSILETLVLLRKFVERSAPELIKIAREETLQRFENVDLTELIMNTKS